MAIFVDANEFIADSARYEAAATADPVFITRDGEVVYVLVAESLLAAGGKGVSASPTASHDSRVNVSSQIHVTMKAGR